MLLKWLRCNSSVWRSRFSNRWINLLLSIRVREIFRLRKNHQSYFAFGRKVAGAAKVGIAKVHSFSQGWKRKHAMNMTLFTAFKTHSIFLKNIKFCKTQSRFYFRYFCIFTMSLCINYPRFSRQTVFSGKYLKIQ